MKPPKPIFLLVSSDTFQRWYRQFSRKAEKSVARLLTPCQFHPVANQPAPDKTMFALRIPRALKVRIQKAAKHHRMSLTDFVMFVLQRETKDVELTPDDYRRIAKEIEAVKSGNPVDNRLRSKRIEKTT